MKFFCAVPMMTIYFAAGLWMLSRVLTDWQFSRLARSWPKVQSDALTLGIVEKTRGTDYIISLDVIYTYQVNGQCFEGKRIAFGYLEVDNSTFSHRILHQHQPMMPVDVYYQPDNPSNSCLVVGFHRYHFNVLLGVVFWIVFGVVLSIGLWFADESPDH